jgi:hypothetical protein
MSDLTVLFYTANRTLPHFMAHVQRRLLAAIGDYPLISVSQQPLPGFGRNICLGDIGWSFVNISRQILVGVRAAETEYVALAEDDVLYSPEHFTAFRPPADRIACDLNRWSIHTWVTPPVFSYRPRHSNTSYLAPRRLMLEALEERFAKFPDESQIPAGWFCEIGRYDRQLGVTRRRIVDYEAPVSHVVFNHPEAYGYRFLGTRKKMGDVRQAEIPYWGRAEELLKLYTGEAV